MTLEALRAVRYAGDEQDVRQFHEDEEFAAIIKDHNAEFDSLTELVRKEKLAHAVRIDRNVLPDLDKAIDDLTERLELQDGLECYVFSYPVIQACAIRSGERFIIGLASAAIERLAPKELEHVIGHEIGHAVYGHLDFPLGAIMQSFETKSDSRIQPKHVIRLMAWSRKCEISADRASLVCCGSLDAAASSMFKVVSGLSVPGMQVHPLQFAAQFDDLQKEIWRHGAEEMVTATHPLLPLRMKALAAYWQSEKLKSLVPEAPGGASDESCDKEVSQLLAHMDPLSHRSETGIDPLLQPFLTWGGLYVAGCNGSIDKSEHLALASFIGERHLKKVMSGPKKLSYFKEQLDLAISDRRAPLSALDVNRIFTCLITITKADGNIETVEMNALHELAKRFGVAPSYVDALLQDPE